MPWSLQNTPELFVHLTLVWIVFSMVRNSRSVSEFGIGAIALNDIRGMLDEFNIYDSDVRLYSIQLVQALDTVYMNHLQKMRK